jgi:hypothetical protein
MVHLWLMGSQLLTPGFLTPGSLSHKQPWIDAIS